MRSAEDEAPPTEEPGVESVTERELAPAEEYLEQLQRLSAEFANYRRRTMRERAEWEIRAKGDLVSSLVPVLDDLDRARSHLDMQTISKEAEGLHLVCSRLEEILQAAGLERQMTEAGTRFNPEIHEAFASANSDEYPEGDIVETLQPGYLFRGILLRPARVCVSRGPAGDDD